MKVAGMVRAAALLVAVAGLLMAINAQAIIINGDVAPDITISGESSPGKAEIAAALYEKGEITDPLLWNGELLYKAEAASTIKGTPATEGGLLKDAYSTAWNPNDYEPTGATITWDGPQWIEQPSYLVVKDGTEGSLLWYLYAVGKDEQWWTGKEDLVIEGVFAGHAISHIDIWGASVAVPEPTTIVAGALLLLPFGLSTLRVLRRNRKA